MDKIRELKKIELEDLQDGMVAENNGKFYKAVLTEASRNNECKGCAFDNECCSGIICTGGLGNERGTFIWVEVEKPECD